MVEQRNFCDEGKQAIIATKKNVTQYVCCNQAAVEINSPPEKFPDSSSRARVLDDSLAQQYFSCR